MWELWWREGGETETRVGLVFCLDPQARLVSKRFGLARRRHPEEGPEYHWVSQTCAGLRSLLGDDGASGEEGGEGMTMGLYVPRLGELGSVVEEVRVMRAKMIAIWAPD